MATNTGLVIHADTSDLLKGAANAQAFAKSTVSAEAAVGKMNETFKATAKSVDKGSVAMSYGSKNANQLAQSMEILTRRGNQGSISMQGFGAALGGFVSIGVASKLIEMADSFQLLRSRVNIAAGGAEAGTVAFNKLFDVSQRLGQSVNTTAALYTRLARPIEEMGGTSADAIRTVETLGKVIALSGVSAREAQSTMLQFGQALASGKLAGDEFKSISENTPDVLNRLSKALGVTRGELRNMSKEGKLTSEVIIGAMKTLATQVDDDFKKLPQTVDKSLNRLGNAVAEELDRINQNSNITAGLSTGITVLADNLNTVTTAAGVFASVLVGKYANSLKESVEASTLFNVVSGKAQAAMIAEAEAASVAAIKNAEEAAAKAALSEQVLALALAKEKQAVVAREELLVANQAAIAAGDEAISKNKLVAAENRVAQARINTTRAIESNIAASEAAQAATARMEVAHTNLTGALNTSGKAAQALGVVFNAMGGWVGLAITAITLLVTYWDEVSNAAGDAAAQQRLAAKAGQEAIKAAAIGDPEAVKKAAKNAEDANARVIENEKEIIRLKNARKKADQDIGNYTRSQNVSALDVQLKDAENLNKQLVISSKKARDDLKTTTDARNQFLKEANEEQQRRNKSAVQIAKEDLENQKKIQAQTKASEEEFDRFQKARAANKGKAGKEETGKSAYTQEFQRLAKESPNISEAKRKDAAEQARRLAEKNWEEEQLKRSSRLTTAQKERNKLEDAFSGIVSDLDQKRAVAENELKNIQSGRIASYGEEEAKLRSQLDTKGRLKNLDEKQTEALLEKARATDKVITSLKVQKEVQAEITKTLEDNANLEASIAALRAGREGTFKNKAEVQAQVSKENPNAGLDQLKPLIDGRYEGEQLKLALAVERTRKELKDTNDERALELSLIGKSAQEQERLRSTASINKKYDKLSIEAPQDDAKALADIEEARQKDLASYQEYVDSKLAMDNDYYTQAQIVMADYTNNTKTMAQATAEIGMNAFNSLEEALNKAATTGKLSFKDMANSVIADISKLIIKMYVMKPLMDSLGGFLGGGFGGSTKTMGGDQFMPMLANGGSVSPASGSYLVGERGAEIFTPSTAGTITPFEQIGGGGGGVSIVINNNTGAAVSTEESTNGKGQREISVIIGEAVASETRRAGSTTNKALQQKFGVQQSLIRR